MKEGSHSFDLSLTKLDIADGSLFARDGNCKQAQIEVAKLLQLAFKITKIAHRAFGTNPLAFSW